MSPLLESQLTPVQQRVLGELSSTGISIVPFAELVDDDDLWSQLKADMDEFVAGAEDELEHGGGAKRKKDFLIRKYPRGKKKLPKEEAILPSDGPWLRYAAGDALLGIVNSYRGAQVKLVDFDQWYTVPVGDDAERVASQEWHRDPEDQHVVKVFLYFSEVDEDAGPFEYVPGSMIGGRRFLAHETITLLRRHAHPFPANSQPVKIAPVAASKQRLFSFHRCGCENRGAARSIR